MRPRALVLWVERSGGARPVGGGTTDGLFVARGGLMTKLADRLLPVVGAAALVAALVLGAGSLKALSGSDGPSPTVAADAVDDHAPSDADRARPRPDRRRRRRRLHSPPTSPPTRHRSRSCTASASSGSAAPAPCSCSATPTATCGSATSSAPTPRRRRRCPRRPPTEPVAFLSNGRAVLDLRRHPGPATASSSRPGWWSPPTSRRSSSGSGSAAWPGPWFETARAGRLRPPADLARGPRARGHDVRPAVPGARRRRGRRTPGRAADRPSALAGCRGRVRRDRLVGME